MGDFAFIWGTPLWGSPVVYVPLGSYKWILLCRLLFLLIWTITPPLTPNTDCAPSQTVPEQYVYVYITTRTLARLTVWKNQGMPDFLHSNEHGNSSHMNLPIDN